MPVPAPLSRLLLLNLVMQVLIVVTGGLVRLTGSGLGCPTWPRCDPGSYTPVLEAADGIHPYVEFGNRLLGVAVGLVALATFLAVLRWARRRPYPLLAGLVLLGTVLQAVLGGITVLTGLNPFTVMAHFLISMVLIALSTLLVWHSRSGRRLPRLDRAPVPVLVRRLGWGIVAVGVLVLVLGTIVTGSGPHSGDAAELARFDLDPRTMSWLHADSVVLFLGLLAAMLVATRLLPGLAAVRRPYDVLLVVTLGQGLIGYVQYALDLPAPLVAAHMLGAGLLVVALTWAQRSLLTLPVAGPENAGPGRLAAPGQAPAGGLRARRQAQPSER